MKRFLYRGRLKRNQIIPIIIILISVFLLVPLFALSFSNEIGQANDKFTSSIISGIYENIIESKLTIVSYKSNKERERQTFPLNIASNFYNLHQYVSASSPIPQNIDLNQTVSKENNDTEIRGKITYDKIVKGVLTKEYILSNGAIFNDQDFKKYTEVGNLQYNKSQELPVRIMEGAIDYNEFYIGSGGEGSSIETMRTYNGTPFTLEQLKDVGFLIRNFYINAPGTSIVEELFDAEVLLGKDMTIQTTNDKPQILIYHTHSQEAFIDSREGVVEDTVVGIGAYLANILEEKYGYNVIHDKGVYDLLDGKLDRNLAYNYAREAIVKILEENPSIEVIIDLHRDGVDKRSTYINGEETAQIMLLNGLSRNQKGPITRLDNPNLQDNLAFSLQLQLKSLEMYPSLFYKNYLEAYRYNLDLRPKSLLIELGTHKNTLKSAKNAMEPFAEILDAVLQGN